MKKSTILILIGSILAVSALGFFIAKSSCSTKCSSKSTSAIHGQAKGCNDCGKNSCNKNCTDSSGKSSLKELVPSCNLTEQQMEVRRDGLKEGIFKKIKSVEEIETGYQLTFNEPAAFSNDLLEFINFERDCCASFSYALVFEPNNKATHLQLYGSKQIKEELKDGLAELGILKNNQAN